ncbi:hypothetical protein PIB30_110031 [Stylosanthes scabra]|uniref:Uncharacterized protein n=1 Tax=Stylosanthes scabra TaxID=79078 RepID=A0ABU6U214_9FABA|nr:hypothetical protein [Stylosanthes scabra]
MEAESIDTLVAQNKALINLLYNKLNNVSFAPANTQIGPCDLCGIQGHSSETCAAILEQQSSEQVVPHKDDTMIPQEIPIAGEAMVRTRETRARQQRQPRQEVPPPQQPPPQVHQQHELPPNFYTHFDASMSQIYRRLDQQ